MSAVAHESSAATRTDSVRVRRVTSTLFAAAALAFLLPFGTVSCSGEEVSVTGLELATHTVDGADEPDSLAAEVEDHGLFALFALVLALVGAVVAALRDRGGGWAIAGLCALFVLGFNADTMLMDIEYGAGYVLALGSFVLAGLMRFCVRTQSLILEDRRVWPWFVGLFAGTPVALVSLVLLGVGSA